MSTHHELVEANGRLATFAATLSHDLLQPVAALDGFLTLLAERATELDDEHRAWLDAAIRGKDRIVATIDAMHRDALADDLSGATHPSDQGAAPDTL